MRNDPVLNFLGIAAKGGNIVSGEFSVEKAVKSHHAYLVIAAGDASSNSRKQFTDMCSFYHTPIRIYGTKESLGACIGKQFRASLAITDEKLAKAVLSKIDGDKEI